MAILEVKKFNNPVLRKKASYVEEINEETKKIIVSLAQTMEKEGGVGIAAPQVGILKRIIIVEAPFRNTNILVLINPKIIKKSKEKEKMEEGCLSFPGIFLTIKRPKEVIVEGKTIEGKKIQLRVKGFLSAVFQHEIDHLDGILFFDRLGFLKRVLFKLKTLLYGFN